MARRRKKPRLFSFSRDVVLSHYDNVMMRPDERAMLEAVVDAFAAICESHRVAPETLMPLARAARHESLLLRGAGITKLTVLCHYFDEAHDVMEQLCRDTDDGVRLFATAALANTPSELAIPLLERCLLDPSWQVRKACAQVGCAVDWRELLPVLEAAATRESDARVQVVLRMAVEHSRSLQDDDDEPELVPK